MSTAASSEQSTLTSYMLKLCQSELVVGRLYCLLEQVLDIMDDLDYGAAGQRNELLDRAQVLLTIARDIAEPIGR